MRAYRLHHIEHLFDNLFRYIVTGKTAAISDSRPWVKYLILLYAALFLSADNSCEDYRTAADKEQRDPQCEIAVISGLRRGSCIAARFIAITGAAASACIVITRKLCRYSLLLGDFLCCFGILVILTAVSTVPIFDIALGILGCRFCFNVLQIRVVVGIQLAVDFAADFALCLVLAGCRAAGVFTQRFVAKVALVIPIGIGTLAQNLVANIAFVIFVTIRVLGFIVFCSALGTLVPMVGFIR